MSKGMIFKGRSEAVHTGQFLIPIWDLVPMSVWERYVYIELCSWAGINSGGDWIRFSPLTMARKYRIGDDLKAENTIRNNIYKAIGGLEEKKVLRTRKGRDNMKEIYLNDIKLCNENKWFKHQTMKMRKKLYRKVDD
jgi:hypothetical protein